ncbi:TonB-dependent receptor plug domain-containing protein [Flavobacterium sp. 3HN19-14]|uniref:TonB-dependent receptor plug domain-containing protein n=1 Tax=Flavobacterium sp. 3HN19-14 TaxID=3448133 RepID=UPI003EE1456F
MTCRKLFLLGFVLMCQCIFAQQIPVGLDEVVISDTQLKNFSNSQSVLKLSDSIIKKNQPSLTALLNYNSVVYFKENGLGMVSSPSFRGTTAAQTAVIWNGININSQTTGQTDFNTITTFDFSSVSVKAGGGSVIYGSSAVGGTIHLNNDLDFGKHFRNEVNAQYGSFETSALHYGIDVSNGNFSLKGSLSANNSENDYPYPKAGMKNENGQFHNKSYNLAFGYQLNPKNFLKLYSQVFDDERHFSLATPSDSRTKYSDFNTRHLAEWDLYQDHFVSKIKLAYLTEEYNYFADIDSDDFSFGKMKTFIAKYDFLYHFNERTSANVIADFTQNDGKGSDILHERRQIATISALFKQHLTDKFLYELSVRKEATSNYKSPLLFSIGGSYAFGFYTLKTNLSRNFRIPTFNDLYWEGAGNPELKPKNSYQGEIGNAFKFGNFVLTAAIYHSEISDMIRWIPNSSGIFSPVNTTKVSVYGLETILNWKKHFGKNNIEFSGTYAYTDSKNKQLDKQLTYVPFHKITAAIGYGFKKFSANYQHLFTGEVFTQADNNPAKTVDMYNVSNISADYDFGKTNVYKIGFRVMNLWDENYESVENRPLPGRNFNVYLTLNF